VERVRQWYVVAQQSFSGKFGVSWSHDKGPANKTTQGGQCTKSWLNKIDNLERVAKRLLRVQIEQLDWQDIVEKYDSPTTLFYMDPPYVRETRTTRGSTGDYDHELSNADHEQLVNYCLDLKGYAILSGYNHPIYERLLEKDDWHFVQQEVLLGTPNAADSKHRDHRTEVLWHNCSNSSSEKIQTGLFSQKHL